MGSCLLQGVGSHAAHLLLRSGVGKLRLVDFDQVTLSSLNRHAVATRQDVGIPKATCLQRHFQQIMPEVRHQAAGSAAVLVQMWILFQVLCSSVDTVRLCCRERRKILMSYLQYPGVCAQQLLPHRTSHLVCSVALLRSQQQPCVSSFDSLLSRFADSSKAYIGAAATTRSCTHHGSEQRAAALSAAATLLTWNRLCSL
jgi:hypothetical protein